jgi:Concanavalin A-like lectin/glucanases superfamily/Immunoglobulin domain/Immunoglobulin I-set domain
VKKAALFVFWLAVLTVTSFAQTLTNTVGFLGTCQSISLSAGSAGSDAYYFTTYDGTTGFPQYQNIGGSPFYSGELRPRAGQPGVYEMDYVLYNNGSIIAYGSFALTLTTYDGDANGLPDIIQLNQAVNYTFTGLQTQDYPNPISNVSISGSMVRAANVNAGTFVINSPLETSSITGNWGINTLTGTATYTRSAGSNYMTITAHNPSGTNFTGGTSFSVDSINKLTLPQFTMVNSQGLSYDILGSTVFTRTSNNRYDGFATYYDFLKSTSWFDFTQWHFEITDTKDQDNNGIPDLSDAAPTAPSITTQPQSATVKTNTGIILSVVATGTAPLGYQWKRSGTNFPGGTTPSLNFSSAKTTDSGVYSVVVSNRYGTITSSNATLTVITPPLITSQPTNLTVGISSNALFTVDVSGGAPYAYQWRFGGTNLDDATDSSLLITNAQTTNAGSYSVVITNFAGSTTSAVATLTVVIQPTITNQPTNQVVSAGSSASFVVGATGTPTLHYQWQFHGTNIPGATASVYPIPSVQPAQTGPYQVIVSNGGGTVTSSVATLSISGPPIIVAQPLSRTNVAGSEASFSVVATGTAPLSYQWNLNGSPLFAANDATLVLSNVGTPNAGNYTVTIANSFGSVTSSVATLVLLYPPTITAQPHNVIVPATFPATLNISATGTAPLGYQWRFYGTNLPGATGTSYTVNSVQVSTAGPYSVLVTNLVGSILSQTANIIIAPPTNTDDCVLAPTNMVSWWTADSLAADLQGTNHGSLNNTTFSPGKVAQAFNLSGTNSFIQVPHSPSLNFTNQISMLAWINPTSNTNVTIRLLDKHTFGGSDGYHLALATNRLQMKLGTVIVNGRSTIPLNTFTFVAATFDGSSHKLYINGVLDTNLVSATTIPINAVALRIGADLAGGSIYKGLIDEVMLFNRALTAAEIQSIYSAGTNGVCKGASIESLNVIPGDQVLVNMKGRTGAAFQLESSYDFSTWTPLITLTNFLGTLQYNDTNALYVPQNFYRVTIP